MFALRILPPIVLIILLTPPGVRARHDINDVTDFNNPSTERDADAGGSWNHKSLYVQLVKMIKRPEDDNEIHQSNTEKERKRRRVRTERGEQIRGEASDFSPIPWSL